MPNRWRKRPWRAAGAPATTSTPAGAAINEPAGIATNHADAVTDRAAARSRAGWAAQAPSNPPAALPHQPENTLPPSTQVKLASVRRSLFSSEAERSKFLNRLVSGTRDVLASKRGLAEHANYHEFCRLLGRLKTNYQLSELVRGGGLLGARGRCIDRFATALRPLHAAFSPPAQCLARRPALPSDDTTPNPTRPQPQRQRQPRNQPRSIPTRTNQKVAVDNYTEWIQLVASMTISSLQSWQWASQSVYYLLGLWSRLVSSMPYLKGDSPSLLEANVPKITEAYISFRWAAPGMRVVWCVCAAFACVLCLCVGACRRRPRSTRPRLTPSQTHDPRPHNTHTHDAGSRPSRRCCSRRARSTRCSTRRST